MEESIVRRLVELNRDFYERFATPFAESRSFRQPGYDRLLQYIPQGRPAILDVGCGNGRFGRYLTDRAVPVDYTGIDFSAQFLAAMDVPGDYYHRDLSQPNCLLGLGEFDFILSLSTLQHIPGRANRERLLGEMRDHLRPESNLALANWQFPENPRQRHKVLPWSAIGLSASDVEEGDYLLSWERGGHGVRYVAHIDEKAINRAAEAVNLRVVTRYYSDGREGDMNLYIILAC
jgi:SAM-dependent methyltransferase